MEVGGGVVVEVEGGMVGEGEGEAEVWLVVG